MKKRPSYTFTTDEIKRALVDYVNKRTGEAYTMDSVEGFGVTQSTNDIRVFNGYIAFEEIETNGPE